MRAAILAIGDELVLGESIDTNSAWLSSTLAAHGAFVDEHRTVGDHRADIAAAVADLASRHDVVLCTGGLGPTADDLTRDALNDVLHPGEGLVMDDAALRALEARYRARRMDMPPSNARQAQRPRLMRMLANPHGTAMGLAGQVNACHVYALPGPPREMKPMVLDHVLPDLAASAAGARRVEAPRLVAVTVHSCGLSEAEAGERLGELTARDRQPQVGITVSASVVSARVRALQQGSASEAAASPDAALAATVEEVQRRWSPYAFGRDGATLPEVVCDLLTKAGRTVSTAESCTGGWLGKALVDPAGASSVYLGGWVTYSDAMKQSQLGVPASILESHGAVSDAAARAMALGALQRAGSDFALAITGIAGPTGGSDAKPVGTVLIALASQPREDLGEPQYRVRQFRFTGDRATIRDRTVKTALQMLRFALLDVPAGTPLLWEARDGASSSRPEATAS